MKLTKDDYKKAIEALKNKKIVTETAKTYQAKFSGYFSSLGPDMNNGILTAIALYESKPWGSGNNSDMADAGQNRNKVCKALLDCVKKPDERFATLYEWASENLVRDKAFTEYKLDKAIIACKVALRLFKEIKNNQYA